jgi:putative hemolysin
LDADPSRQHEQKDSVTFAASPADAVPDCRLEQKYGQSIEIEAEDQVLLIILLCWSVAWSVHRNPISQNEHGVLWSVLSDEVRVFAAEEQKGRAVMEMNSILMLVLLVMLLGLSAFFSGSETALMAISRLRLTHLAKTKPIRAGTVQGILKKPERLIGTILLGNDLVNVAMSAIATAFAVSLWGQKGIAYVTVVLTIVILIFGEITPKVYAKYFNERVSFLTAPFLNGVMIFFNPVVVAVTYVTNKILLLVGVDVSKMKRPLMTEDEIRTCIKMGWDEGAIMAEERKMLSRVFTLNDRTVGEAMVPKGKMTVLDAKASTDETIRAIVKTGYSRFPVKEGKNLHIIGLVHAKDLFGLADHGRPISLNRILRPPYQSVVLDSTGEVTGLITLEDILEELVGSIQDEHDE